VQRLLSRPASIAARQLTFHLVMRHEPDITRAGQEDIAVFRDRLAALAASPVPQCCFYTDSEDIAARFHTLLGGSGHWRVLPVPLPSGIRALRQRRTARPRESVRIAMMGSPRMERGFGVLPDLLDCLPASIAGHPVVLVVQVDRGAPDPRVREVVHRLEARPCRADASGPRLELLDGPLPETDYFAHLASADVLLLPLLSTKYECSTSGVFVEGIRLGIPAVVMQGTWTASIVEKVRTRGFRIGLIVQEVEAIARGVVEVSESLAEYEAGVAAYLDSLDVGVEPSIPSLLLAASTVLWGTTHYAAPGQPDEAR